ncbi:MAG: hypothetical protein Q9169_006649 [Polycauliona sp. 2 TL-2023]
MTGTFSQNDRDKLFGFFTRDEWLAVQSAFAKEQLVAVVAIHRSDQSPTSPSARVQDEVADFLYFTSADSSLDVDVDAEGEDEDLDAAPYTTTGVDPGPATRKGPPSRRIPTTKLSSPFLKVPEAGDRQTKSNKQRPSRLSSPPLKNTSGQKSKRHNDTDQRASSPPGRHNHTNLLGSISRSTTSQGVSKSTPAQRTRSGQAPTGLERRQARAEVDRLLKQLHRGGGHRTETAKLNKEIRRWTAIAEGGDIEPMAEQQTPRTATGRRPSTHRPGTIFHEGIDEGGYLPREKEDMQKQWASEVPVEEDEEEVQEIDFAGNLIPRGATSTSGLSSTIDAHGSHGRRGYPLGYPIQQPAEEEDYGLFEDDGAVDASPKPLHSKRRRTGGQDDGGRRRRH